MKKLLKVLIALLPVLAMSQMKGIKHVIVIGLDGTGANYLKRVEDIPNIKGLMAAGSYTMHARAVRETSSAVNWAAMMMGASPVLTGYTHWDSKTPEIPSRVLGKYGMFPTIYEILREQKPKMKIGVIYTWSGIGYLFPKQVVDRDDHTDNDSLTATRGVNYIKTEKPNLLFLHFDGVDHAGHTIGWGTPEYTQAIQKVDEYIGNVVRAVKDAGIMDETVILVTADHGGFNKSHGGDHIEEVEIPWILFGKKVKRNHELQQSIMTYDTASTIASIFGVKQPQVWIGRPVTEAFNK